MYSLEKSFRVIRLDFFKFKLFYADLFLKLLTSSSNELIKCLALILNCSLKISNKFLDCFMLLVIVMAMTLSVANMLFFLLQPELDLLFNFLSERLDSFNSS